MKRCELCSFPARMHCESDQACLCWDCDETVHSANFLVAKHSRNLLCHVCQSPTPWTASGPKLWPTVSVCETCVHNYNANPERGEELEEEIERGSEDEDDYTDDDGETGESSDEEDIENQIVPLFSTTPSPTPVTSSSSSEEVSLSRFFAVDGGGISKLKRTHEIADLDSEDDISCSSSRFPRNAAMSTVITSSRASGDEEVTSLRAFRPFKVRRTYETIRSQGIQDSGEAESSTTAIVKAITRFSQSMIAGDENASAMILWVRKLSRDPPVVDINSVSTNQNLVKLP